MSQPVSVAKSVIDSLSFLARERWAILARAALPIALAWITWYVSLDAYLSQLERFLTSPTARTSSLALGLIAAGFFLALFFHAVLTVAMTEAAFGVTRARWRYFRAARQEWRYYAAMLRLLLVLGVLLTGILAPVAGLHLLPRLAHGGAAVSPYVNALIVVALLATVVRIGFLIGPIVVMENGQVLRRSLMLSRHHALAFLAIVLACGMTGIFVQLTMETVLKFSGELPAVLYGGSFVQLVRMLHAILPQFLSIAMSSYLVSVVLFAGAAVSVYRTVTDASEEQASAAEHARGAIQLRSS